MAKFCIPTNNHSKPETRYRNKKIKIQINRKYTNKIAYKK